MYVKLFASILDSSVWHESPATVKVWITLLVMADEHGFVRGVEKALAHRAVVSPEDCRLALELLEAPDLESQTQEFAGRRIEKVEGGWQVLNYTKYRELRTREQVKEAGRKARQREVKKVAKSKPAQQIEEAAGVGVDDVPGHVPDVPTIASATASAPEVAVSSSAREAEVLEHPTTISPAALPTALPPAWSIEHARATGEPPPDAIPMIPADPLAELFVHDAHEQAYVSIRRGHRMPQAFDAALRDVHQPLTGGVAYTWEEIGAALMQLLGNGESFNVARLRGYCRSLRAGAPPTTYRAAVTGEATVELAPDITLTPPRFWDLCRESGLTAAMLSKTTVGEIIARLVESGEIGDGSAFASLVMHVQPWSLAEIKFPPEQQRTLAERMAAWTAREARRTAGAT